MRDALPNYFLLDTQPEARLTPEVVTEAFVHIVEHVGQGGIPEHSTGVLVLSARAEAVHHQEAFRLQQLVQFFLSHAQ